MDTFLNTYNLLLYNAYFTTMLITSEGLEILNSQKDLFFFTINNQKSSWFWLNLVDYQILQPSMKVTVKYKQNKWTTIVAMNISKVTA